MPRPRHDRIIGSTPDDEAQAQAQAEKAGEG
jgi:hypothetical protein